VDLQLLPYFFCQPTVAFPASERYCYWPLSAIAPTELALVSGVAIGWAGWAKSRGPPSAGAPSSKQKKF